MGKVSKWLFGGPSSGEHGYMVDLSSGWPWPLWATILLVLAIICALWWLYFHRIGDLHKRKRAVLFVLRLMAATIIFGMLGQWTLIRQRTTLPVIALVIDDSLSMSLTDERLPGRRNVSDESHEQDARVSRWRAAVNILTAEQDGALRKLQARYRLRAYRLGDLTGLGNTVEQVAASLRDLSPQRDSTPLGQTLLGIMDQLRGNELAAIVTFSDGVNNDGPGLRDAAAEARRRLIPIFFVGLGEDVPRPDVALQNWLMEERVFWQDKVVLRAEVTVKNSTQKSVDVELLDDDTKSVIGRKTITINENGTGEVVMVFVPPKEGQNSLRLQCKPLERETALDNNSLVKALWVEKRPVRIALIGATPGFEFRFLKNGLNREKNFLLDAILLSADPELGQEAQEGLSLIRGAKEKLWSSDVIVLVDVPASAFPSRVWADVAGFVDTHDTPGGLVVIAGEQFRWDEISATPLARVLPIQPARTTPPMRFDQGQRIVPTEDGLRMPWLALGTTDEESRRIWSQMPGIFFCQSSGTIKPGARILARLEGKTRQAAETVPVFVFQYVGRGRVLFHATDETWRWRKVTDMSWWRQFWVELLRCMARGRLETAAGMVLTTDRSTYLPGEPVWLTLERLPGGRATDCGLGVNVWLQHEGGQRRQVTLQRPSLEANAYQAVLRNLPPGRYQAWVPGQQGSVRVSFTVMAPKKELEETEPAWREMEEAAAHSGGGVYRADQTDQLLRSLPPGKASPVEVLPPLALWNRPAVLALIIALLTAEWVLRKRWGLS